MTEPPVSKAFKTTPAILFLIAVNLIPVFGIIYLNWDVGTLLLLYWLETAIIGLVNMPKIWACEDTVSEKIFITLFFIVHFGGFNLGHLIFLTQMFEVGDLRSALFSGPMLIWAAAGLLLSHIFSLIINFFGKKEYEGRKAKEQMFSPYGRVIVMHVVVIFGGFLAAMFGAPLLALLLLVVIKIIIDITAHKLEHRGKPMPKISNAS